MFARFARFREQLVQIELYQTEQFARFLDKLRSIREPDSDGTLLDSTMALLGSGMGNGNAHTNYDLPILLAGGGFKHGQHLAFDPKNHPPLCNLYVSMLQRLGIEYGELLPARKLLERLYERVRSTTEICGCGDGI